MIDETSKDLMEYEAILGYSTDTSRSARQVPQTRKFVNGNELYEWDKLPVSAKLTDEQAMLCPAVIGCHDLRSKKKYTVSVDNLKPVEWNKDAMDHLVLDTRKKDMLKGLVSYHSNRNRGNEQADLIAGKGQSLVILLHGPPGVRSLPIVGSISPKYRLIYSMLGWEDADGRVNR